MIRSIHNYKTRILLRKIPFRVLSSTNASSENANEIKVEKSFREKVKDTWNGPTFKYWFIGGTGFFCWLGYYSYQAYKNKCIDIDLPPPLPNHFILDREKELDILFEKFKEQGAVFFNKNNIRKLMILGPSSSGKTTLAYQFINKLKQSQSSSMTLPVSKVSFFLQTNSEAAFLISLKSAAAKLEVLMSDLDQCVAGGAFHKATFQEQCDSLIINIQDKLEKHPGWVIVFDQLQATTPKNLVDIMNGCLKDEESWSSGVFIIVADGVNPKSIEVDETSILSLHKGLSKEDGVAFLKKLVNVDGNVESLHILVDKAYGNPLALLCTGLMLKQKLATKEVQTIDNVVKEICLEIDSSVKKVLKNNQHLSPFLSTYSGRKLLTIESIVALYMKDVLSSNQYLYNGLDLMSLLAPGTPVPQQVITRHLSSPFYKLPSLAKPPNMLDFMSKQKRDAEDVMKHADDFDPKGKAWSNKNLVHYVQKVEEFFGTAYKTMKDIYFMVYGELPELPKGDDGMGMFDNCSLVQSSITQPGDVKSFSLHPLVYSVARQHFIATTLPDIEEKNLLENKDFHENKSWYRRFSTFNEQSILQQYRNRAGVEEINKNLTEQEASSLLFRFNLGIDVSAILQNDQQQQQQQQREDFWTPKPIEKLALLQDNLSRVVDSLCEQLNVTKGDLSGHSTKKLLIVHLEYILKNQPYELLGPKNQCKILFNLARSYSSVYKDTEASSQLINQVLTMQRSMADTDPLEIARTLAESANYHINTEDYESAKDLLTEASELYEANRRKLGEYKHPIEYGKLLGVLGAVYGSLGMKVESKETIERALMMQQSVPPDMSDDEKSKKFGAEFASTLIDLAHSYVSLGLPLYGKKIVDLALSAQKNLNGEEHPEVVRALTVLAMAHLMQGHNEESKKFRKEAGKIQASLKKSPLY